LLERALGGPGRAGLLHGINWIRVTSYPQHSACYGNTDIRDLTGGGGRSA
jgi:hypothetical protein